MGQKVISFGSRQCHLNPSNRLGVLGRRRQEQQPKQSVPGVRQMRSLSLKNSASPIGRLSNATVRNPGGIDGFRGGQLKNYLTRWQKLGAPAPILKIISGYSIPFVVKLPSVPLGNKLLIKRFATETTSNMTKELETLLKSGVIERCRAKTGFLSRMFLIPKSNGKMRQIFDLRRLNACLKPQKFRLVNQFRVPSFLQEGDYMVKLDFRQAYFHIPIKIGHRRY